MDAFFITKTNDLFSEVSSCLSYEEGSLPECSKVVARKYADFIQTRQEDSKEFGLGAYPAANPTEFQIFADEVVFNLMRVIATKPKQMDITCLQAHDPIRVIFEENFVIEGVPDGEGLVTTGMLWAYGAGYLTLFPPAYNHKGWDKISFTKKLATAVRNKDLHDDTAFAILKQDPGLLPDAIIQEVFKQDDGDVCEGDQEVKDVRKGIQEEMKKRWWTEDESPKLRAAAIFDLMNAADCLLFVTQAYLDYYKSEHPGTLRKAWRKVF